MKIMVIGGGRMGSLLVSLLSPHYNVVCIEKNKLTGRNIFLHQRIMVSDSLNIVPKADFIILSLPSEAIINAAKELAELIKPGQIIINTATNTFAPEIKHLFQPENPIISAKIIGHFQSISEAEPPMIVIDPGSEDYDSEVIRKVAEVFSKIGLITFGKEETVSKLNSIASEEGIRCAVAIKNRLREAGIPEGFYSFAVRNVAVGTMKAFAVGEAGPFAQKIIKQILSQQQGD